LGAVSVVSLWVRPHLAGGTSRANARRSSCIRAARPDEPYSDPADVRYGVVGHVACRETEYADEEKKQHV